MQGISLLCLVNLHFSSSNRTFGANLEQIVPLRVPLLRAFHLRQERADHDGVLLWIA